LRALFNLRDPLYREASHYVFDTGRPSINKLLHAIIEKLELEGFDTHTSQHTSQHAPHPSSNRS